MNKLLIFITCLLLVGTLQAQEVQQNQMSLVTKKTATWCPICGGSAWDAFLQMLDESEGKSIPVAAHFSSSSALYSASAEAIVDQFDFVPGQPVFYFNSTKLSGRNAATAADVKERVDAAYATAPAIKLGVQAGFEDGNLKIDYVMQADAEVAGTYIAGLYPIRKSVMASQAGNSNSADHKQILDNELHTGLSESLPDAHFGLLVAGDGFAGTSSRSTTFNLPGYTEAIEKGNLEIALIVWKKTGDNSYEFVNAAAADVVMGFISSVETLDNSISELNVLSTNDSSLIEVDAKTLLNNAVLNVYSINGSLVQTAFSGKLANGKHQFQFNGEAGIYVAHLLVDGKQLTKKFIIH